MKKILFVIFFTFLFFTIRNTYAWTGYDYESKTEIEISEGNLVREGMVFQFYESKIDNYHTAKVLFIDAVAGGTKIQLQELDSDKERTFIMKDE